MFVIAQCWSNMQKDPLNAGLGLPDRMGIALKHAGVSVTVTSLTDVFAFGVGAVTVGATYQRTLSKNTVSNSQSTYSSSVILTLKI